MMATAAAAPAVVPPPVISTSDMPHHHHHHHHQAVPLSTKTSSSSPLSPTSQDTASSNNKIDTLLNAEDSKDNDQSNKRQNLRIKSHEGKYIYSSFPPLVPPKMLRVGVDGLFKCFIMH